MNAVETGDAGQSTMAVVLAGGRGTRMQSDLPKVLFPVHGRPMIHWVLDALDRAGVEEKIVVVGYRAELVQEELRDRAGVRFALQEQQLGTGHAVQMAIPYLNKHAGTVLVVAGDSPMVQSSSLLRLLERFSSSGAACLLGTLIKENPKGLGRILRDAEGRFSGIVEEKDATESQKAIHEVNMSTYLFRVKPLLEALAALGNHNAQGEYYLTDIVALAVAEGLTVCATHPTEVWEVEGVNSKVQLAALERIHQRNLAQQLLEQGVTLADPSRLDVRGELV
ncbi:MAG: NTP transferase domain-containing protein, partial [Pirellulaceae bacterium]